ncbi:MAG TPA: methyltransferase domain-containing protein, partial [Chloroflexota bacterium]|nr:methyltransferase domain-containing protein [Chloroflexota bacterium]
DKNVLWPDAPDRQARWAQLLTWLDPQPGEQILDLGCGNGAATALIADRIGDNGRAVGLDHFPESLAKSRAQCFTTTPTPPSLVCGLGQALPFANASFDALLCVDVLEAIPDRESALAEMRRVLKPGGRILLAHGDYESLAYAGADRDLTRRAVYAYANSKFQSYEAADGQMGRRLWGMFSRAGFTDAEARVVPLVNTEYREPLVGWTLAQFNADFVAAVSDLTQPEIDRWHQELAAASERGEYFFCANMYVCLGRKPVAKRIAKLRV